jgi:hypothetical protein
MAAIFWSGIGGYALFTPTGGATQTVANQNWAADYSNRLAEVTNAGSGGNAQYIATVQEQQGTFDIFWNSLLLPYQAGIVPGGTGIIQLLYGTSGHSDTQFIIIEKASPKLNTQNGAIMVSIAYRGNSTPVQV